MEGVGGVAGVLSSLDASDGAEEGGEAGRGSGKPQPSIPKSSVNFFTFIRSSVLTVGRVVDSERSMSDCGGSRRFDQSVSDWLRVHLDLLLSE